MRIVSTTENGTQIIRVHEDGAGLFVALVALFVACVALGVAWHAQNEVEALRFQAAQGVPLL